MMKLVRKLLSETLIPTNWFYDSVYLNFESCLEYYISIFYSDISIYDSGLY